MPRGIRFNPQHSDRTRAKIQTSQIINRLQSLVKGEIEMSGPQVRAAEILLGKTLPNLSNVEMSGNADNPIGLRITWGTSQK